MTTHNYAPIAMVLYSREGEPRQIVVGSAPDTTQGWAALPMLASLAGFDRDAFRGNVYVDGDGSTWVGSWKSTDVAAADVVIYAPSAYLPTRLYRRRRVLDSLAILRAAGYPLDRLHTLVHEVGR